MNVSWDHSAGTMASSAPASMKVAPEAVFQRTGKRSFLTDDKTGSTDHGHA
jgi:hypothetical protein